MPITTSKLNIFEPIKLPIDKSFCLFNEAITDAANSGILVPIATMVILIILSEKSSLLATDTADFIRVSEPNHNRDPIDKLKAEFIDSIESQKANLNFSKNDL